MDKGTMMRLTGLNHGVDSIPEKPRRGRRCRPGTKHPYDGEAERKIQRVCHA